MSGVFTWGSNQYRQLGSSNAVGLHQYVPIPLAEACTTSCNPETVVSMNPVQVAAGEGHTLILTEDGQIHAFGRGREGQLGTGTTSGSVVDIENETIIQVAAGALTSYAVTLSGQVYQWGLVHKSVNHDSDDDENHPEENGAQSGQLPGMAQNQDSVITPDVVARESRAEVMRDQGNTQESRPAASNSGGRNRQLREIVRDSTERWLMPTADADREYYEELRAMGYQVEEAEERMQERGREYHGMISMGCTRKAQHVPRRIPGLNKVRVSSVSAGYAHVLLLSEEGQLYAAGYNDRGQLGLGHRINTSEFKHVKYLSNKRVLQVVCGQQHTICRATDSDPNRSHKISSDDYSYVICGNAYVWGNGILGQLGIGVRGTSKGRLLPTLVESLAMEHPDGIADVGAGGNFTVAVTKEGQVYSFGHAEYNQHGTGNRAYRDYVDPHYYFVPRSILENVQVSRNGQVTPLRIRSVYCGSNYTLGVDFHGDVYSWGWNESGVLGHGILHYSSEPQRVSGVGDYIGRRVLSVAAGAKHVVLLAETQCNAWASRFAPPSMTLAQSSDQYIDCELTVDTGEEGAVLTYPAHKAVLSSRSYYLKGFVLAAEAECSAGEIGARVSLSISSEHANADTMKELMEYIYMDKTPVVTARQQRGHLLSLARELGLHALCARMQSSGPYIIKEHSSRSGQQQLVSHSSYVRDMDELLHSGLHADLMFTASPSLLEDQPDLADKESNKVALLSAHRAIVSRVPYFAALLGGGFGDSHLPLASCAHIHDCTAALSEACMDPPSIAGARASMQEVCVDGLLMDGITAQSFYEVIHFAYTGECALAKHSHSLEKGPDKGDGERHAVMNVLVAANRFGFKVLAQQCERKLSLNLERFSSLVVQEVLQFALAYNLTRLEKQCMSTMTRKAT